jgi:hypothetical protein
MKAAAYTRYGPPDVVQIMDVVKPVPRAHSTTACLPDGAAASQADVRCPRVGLSICSPIRSPIKGESLLIYPTPIQRFRLIFSTSVR